MKLWLLTFSSFITFSAMAIEVYIQPSGIAMECKKGLLSIVIPKVAVYTSSGADTFTLENNNQSICQALKEHIVGSKRLMAKINISILNMETLIDLPPCIEDTCNATYKYYKSERINLYLNGLPFNAQKEIPNTGKLKTVYWDRYSCPPYKPDCDL